MHDYVEAMKFTLIVHSMHFPFRHFAMLVA